MDESANPQVTLEQLQQSWAGVQAARGTHHFSNRRREHAMLVGLRRTQLAHGGRPEIERGSQGKGYGGLRIVD